jgi:dihydrodipicolinate synthase/N-acetylneuraminate lyase
MAQLSTPNVNLHTDTELVGRLIKIIFLHPQSKRELKKLYPLFGIVTVLNTPFKSDDSIDYPALKNNVRDALNAGVAGFLVPAMAAEVYKLTEYERIGMVDAVLAEVNGKVPVIAGAGETDKHKSKRLLKSYCDLGCRQVLFQIPYQSSAQFQAHFAELANLDVEMIMLQDWDASGYGLPDELIVALFEAADTFKCLKIETVPAGVKYSKVLELTGGQLHISGGWAVSQMIEGLTRGVHAFMPTGMHWIYTEIYNLWMNTEKQQATRLFRELLTVLAFSNQHLDISVHFFKQLLHQQGTYPTARVREPILPFDEIHQEITNELILKVMSMEQHIKMGRR